MAEKAMVSGDVRFGQVPGQDARAVARVAKHFYDRFRVEREAFLQSITGMAAQEDRAWYASLLLSHLMFVYFLQRRGFLDGNPDYLRDRLEAARARRGAGAAPSFYRAFLLRLFRDGLGGEVADVEGGTLLGNVPYLGGGLFAPHRLEEANPGLDIPDEAFARVFHFFDGYDWCLDDQLPGHECRITPDILGHIFEQQINQKESGAYYTQEDVTGYIGANAIIPCLLDRVAEDAPAAFAPDGPAWRLLRDNPDRYIHDAMLHGVDLPLPEDIAAGEHDPGGRGGWNRPAAHGFALPTETWREHLTRRARCQGLRARLRAGEVRAIDDLITLNLDIGRFALDIIAHGGGPDLAVAFYRALERITVLDPTCGSGAFLFAALKILRPLYTACLDRMQSFVGAATAESGHGGQPIEGDEYCRAALARAAAHPGRDYFVVKSLLLNNLYGVDLMEEAVEICKLRLFLALIARAVPDPGKPNYGLELLPDLDLNIRAGNALVGFATADENWTADEDWRASHGARHAPDPLATPAAGAGHRPFHWPVEFPAVMGRGGFDAIIGNPPYLAYSKVRGLYTVRGYRTAPCGNLYALVVERALALLRPRGRLGMIVPIASVSTDGMRRLQGLYGPHAQWHSHYAVRPGKLFAGVDMNLTITLLCKGDGSDGDESALPPAYGTGYRRWSGGARGDRSTVFGTLRYVDIAEWRERRPSNPYPKLGSEIEAAILRRMLAHGHTLGEYQVTEGETLYYHSGGRYWRKALPQRLSSHYKPITVPGALSPVIFGLLNSQLFYWYWIANSNCMDVVTREVLGLPVFDLRRADRAAFTALRERLLASYAISSVPRRRQGGRIDVEEINFDVRRSKSILDEIDRLLARHYGFTAEEMDAILNYDIKYRMAGDAAGDPAI